MNFAQESQMDILAEKLGIDPLEFRLRNYRGLGEIDPVFDDEIRSDGLKECVEKGAKSFGWQEKWNREPSRGTKKRGAGMSIMLHGTGAAGALPDPASATVMMNSDGSVNLVCSRR
jgi:xanthine dehydrogenase molybdenum-binding subunit